MSVTVSNSKPSNWTQGIKPEPDWGMEQVSQDGDVVVIARRWGYVGSVPSEGPSEVLIRLSDSASPAARRRGITSGVLRRVERLVAEMTDEMNTSPDAAEERARVSFGVITALSELPSGPKQGRDAYYGGLLDIFEGLVSSGHPEPVNVLAEGMRTTKDTAKTRLRNAREWRKVNAGPTTTQASRSESTIRDA